MSIINILPPPPRLPPLPVNHVRTLLAATILSEGPKKIHNLVKGHVYLSLTCFSSLLTRVHLMKYGCLNPDMFPLTFTSANSGS